MGLGLWNELVDVPEAEGEPEKGGAANGPLGELAGQGTTAHFQPGMGGPGHRRQRSPGAQV